MSVLSRRTINIVRVFAYYFRNPGRWPEVVAWFRERRGEDVSILRRPWWNYLTVAKMGDRVTTGTRVFEYGGGASTLWMEDRGACCVTVEHDRDWFVQLSAQMRSESNSKLYLVEPTLDGSIVSSVNPGVFFDDYVFAIEKQSSGSVDLVVVDGRARVECARAARRAVRPGGAILLDDSHRQKYKEVEQIFADWPREDFVGLKHRGGFQLLRTSVWTRPVTI